MKYYLIMFWLLMPVAAAAYHFGPGQQRIVKDELVRKLSQADKLVRAEQYPEAVSAYDDALKMIPNELPEKRMQVRLEKAKAQMKAGGLPEAYQELNGLMDEASESTSVTPKFMADIRQTLANAEYYVTWVLRLEGEPKEVWRPFIESSRQTYRLLTEQAAAQNQTQLAAALQQDLEGTIRLERMTIEELQGLNLPSQCKCKGSCKCCCKGKKPGKQGKTPKDFRDGAGMGDEIQRAGS
jgi:tetratricopeptide (TPR) repeat protein